MQAADFLVLTITGNCCIAHPLWWYRFGLCSVVLGIVVRLARLSCRDEPRKASYSTPYCPSAHLSRATTYSLPYRLHTGEKTPSIRVVQVRNFPWLLSQSRAMSAAHTLRCSHLQSARNVMRYTPVTMTVLSDPNKAGIDETTESPCTGTCPSPIHCGCTNFLDQGLLSQRTHHLSKLQEDIEQTGSPIPSKKLAQGAERFVIASAPVSRKSAQAPARAQRASPRSHRTS